jgi:RNA polymerase sigma-70 factor, ECF subfamily
MGLGEVRLRGLLLGGLAGDSSAYHTFLKELSGHLRAFLRKRLVNLPEEVEDLVQELLLAVHNQRHTYDPGQPITAWIYTIACYKLIDLLRLSVAETARLIGMSQSAVKVGVHRGLTALAAKIRSES